MTDPNLMYLGFIALSTLGVGLFLTFVGVPLPKKPFQEKVSSSWDKKPRIMYFGEGGVGYESRIDSREAHFLGDGRTYYDLKLVDGTPLRGVDWEKDCIVPKDPRLLEGGEYTILCRVDKLNKHTRWRKLEVDAVDDLIESSRKQVKQELIEELEAQRRLADKLAGTSSFPAFAQELAERQGKVGGV